MSLRDVYAGNDAWQEWFDLCAVARCSMEHASALTEQIRRAMHAQLARSGYEQAIVDNDNPVTFFDTYFKMAGSRETQKPLKSYFRYRIAREGLSLRDFVCGTLFSARFGRIHDIVRDWIASIKGWTPHALVGDDGKRHLVWESAAAKEDIRECVRCYLPDPTARLDQQFLRGYVAEMLDFVSTKIKLEKSLVAFLLMVTAQGVPMSSPDVLARLKVRKSRAAQLKEKCMKTVQKYFQDKEIETNDLPLARAMISVCTAVAGEEVCHG